MDKFKAVFSILLIVFLITSCGSSAATPQTSLTKAVDTAESIAWTPIPETATPMPTSTPAATQFAAFPGASFNAVPPQADEQVYIDPQGWYSVNFPADMKSVDKPNVFWAGSRFIEIGNLPYMSRSINLCLWLANIVSKPEQSYLNWMHPCSVTATNENGFNVEYEIYENVLADPEHRFIYVKMGGPGPGFAGLFIRHTVSWLKTTPETYSGSAPLSSEESSFWENPTTMLNGALLTEYVLPPEAQAGPTAEMLRRYVPEEAQPDWAILRSDASTSQAEPTQEEQLKSLGYELKSLETGQGLRHQLFRDGRILFDDVKGVSEIYTIPSDAGLNHAFIVETVDLRQDDYFYFKSYLIVNDAIHSWEDSAQDPGFAPILYEGELLWAFGTQDSHVEVKRSNGEVLFTFESYFATHLEVDSFQSWNGHWVLTAGDFAIQDGEFLNQTLGFQEIFEWSVVDDKPVYLFRRGSRLGLSYDGKFLLLPYEEIPRGLCCGFASNNPMTIDDTMYFFGKRDGTWYYAVIKFR